MKQLELFPEKKPNDHEEIKIRNSFPKSSISLATWNVNSIRARLTLVKDWINKKDPDVVCLQEIKVDDENFPYSDFRQLGYNSLVYGQKTYNGVAILSKIPIQSYSKGFGDEYFDRSARIIYADMTHFHLITVYVPNAKSINDESFNFKIKWLSELYNLINNKLSIDDRIIICGDFNVAPSQNDLDDPKYYLYRTFIHAKIRDEFFKILNWGLVDSFRLLNASSDNYTWWDYRGKAFEQNKGMRIDHILVSHSLKNLVNKVIIDKNARASIKPSDHAPISAEISLYTF